MVTARVLTKDEQGIAHRHRSGAEQLSSAMPRLVSDARRAAASVVAGVHGRRRAGTGETFWQFRFFTSGEPASRVDWRRSARDDRLYVREREWEAAQSIWLWLDRSPSMAYQSSLSPISKLDRGLVIGLAAADMLVRGGERVGLIGLTPPIASRRIIERLAEALVLDRNPGAGLPSSHSLGARSEAILVSDFIAPLDEIDAALKRLSDRGARGHLVMVRDPAEDLFPFAGRTEFTDPEDGFRLRVGDAEGFKATYHNRIAAHLEGVRQSALRLGWSFTLHRTDRPVSETVMRLGLALQAGGRG